MKRDDQFLRKEYMKNLYPIMFSVLGGTINALIDSAFVSQRLGSEGLASINMSLPVYLAICTIGSLIAGGASVLSAQAAGKERMDESEKYYRNSIWILVILGLLFTTVGMLLCRPLASFLAHDGTITGYVYSYCLIMLSGTLPTILLYIPLYYLQIEGKTKQISVMMTLIIVIDVLLDYFLMFVLNMEIEGAAVASVVSILIACIYGFVMLSTGYSNYHFDIRSFSMAGIGKMIVLGSPVALGNFVDAIKLFVLNYLILIGGGTTAVAIWAVINSLSEFAMSIISGVPQAAAPMAGTYYSGRENSGLRILVRLQLSTGILLTGTYAALIVLFHGIIENIFVLGTDISVQLVCLGAYCVFDILSSIWITFFQSTARIQESNTIIMFRKLLFPIGFAILLITVNGYIWLFLPAGALCTVFAGLILTWIKSLRTRKSKHHLSPILLLDDYLERENKVIDFSIVPTTENICDASEQIKEFCERNNMSTKQTMKLGLAIEELMSVIAKKNQNLDSVDLRAFAWEENTGIRIRCAGIQYNPFDDEEDDDDFLMGVSMIKKMSEVVYYTYSLGMNTINILFETEKNT